MYAQGQGLHHDAGLPAAPQRPLLAPTSYRHSDRDLASYLYGTNWLNRGVYTSWTLRSRAAQDAMRPQQRGRGS